MSQYSLKRMPDGPETPITDPVIAGRSPECGLLLPTGGPEGGTSRRHAQISIGDGAMWVEDLGSKNGTFVNDVRVTGKTRLRAGDRLRFDQIEFHVKAPPEMEPTVVRVPPTQVRAAAAPSADSPAPKAAAPAAPVPPQKAPPAAAPPPPRPAALAEPQPPKPAAPAGPQSAKVATPAAQAKSPAAAPRAAQPASPAGVAPAKKEDGRSRAPGAWADPDEARGDGKTVFIDPNRVRELLQQPPKAGRAAGEVDAPTLTFTQGSRAGGRVKLRATAQRGESTEWTLGSDPNSDIPLSDDGVSAVHASIVNEGERWKIIDRLSTNGTFVNDRRTNTSFLASGDVLSFGRVVTCMFELPGGRSARQSSPRPAKKVVRDSSRIDLMTLLISFLVTAAVLLVVWRYLR
jgi:pSer/pThr/pTyr-binding forkhead associated (FHA) protein